MSEFIDKLLLIDIVDDSTQLDFLFDTIDDLLIDRNYKQVDEYILEFNKNFDRFNLYVGFLTIINLHKNKLKNIEKLQMKSISAGQKIMSLKDSISTLHGLLSDKVIKIKMRNEKLKQINEKYL